MNYISKASKFFEAPDRRSYQTLLENKRRAGYSIVVIPIPEPVSVPTKAAKARAQ